jgi:outer membrane translocation and assembly module TamA
LEVFFSVSREVTRPGQVGLQLRQGFQRIPRADVLFAGLSFRYARLDRVGNPSRGFYVESRLERGRKQRSQFELTADGDTSSVRSVVRQERLTAAGRVYIPVFRQQTIAIGNETSVLVSRVVDESDLFRLGGARSLRGYDEDRFRGRLVSRAFFEYRYLFERRSYAYAFFDLGYVDQPALADRSGARGVYPGYGFGIQFETGIGLINTSLALSTTDAHSQAKVHVGLSVGL